MKLSSSTAICRLGRCEVALRYGLGGTQRCEAHKDIYSTSSGVAVYTRTEVPRTVCWRCM